MENASRFPSDPDTYTNPLDTTGAPATAVPVAIRPFQIGAQLDEAQVAEKASRYPESVAT
jgi:hypothetical protein